MGGTRRKVDVVEVRSGRIPDAALNVHVCFVADVLGAWGWLVVICGGGGWGGVGGRL